MALRASTDRALMVVVGCNLFEWGTFLRRIDNFLMDLAVDAANVERLLDALLEIHFATLDKVYRRPWATSWISSASATTWAWTTGR